MAIAVIGGLVTSTLLSLLVVPVVLTYVEGIEQAFKRRFVGKSASSATLPQASSQMQMLDEAAR